MPFTLSRVGPKYNTHVIMVIIKKNITITFVIPKFYILMIGF